MRDTDLEQLTDKLAEAMRAVDALDVLAKKIFTTEHLYALSTIRYQLGMLQYRAGGCGVNQSEAIQDNSPII